MGTKLVMPGPKLDGASVYELLDSEKVTCTAGVPTVWLMLLNYMAQNNLKLPYLKFLICGGSAMPRSMIKAFVDMGIEVRHAWGMTEMSPLGTLGALKPPFANAIGEERLDLLQLQGYPPFGVQATRCLGMARALAGSRSPGRRCPRLITASTRRSWMTTASSTPAT
jgi:fatty-acyl-CoA synthase